MRIIKNLWPGGGKDKALPRGNYTFGKRDNAIYDDFADGMMTLREIGAKYGISNQKVREIGVEILRKLKLVEADASS